MAGASRGILMTDGREGAARAVGRWIAGIVAAVVGSVLTFIVIGKISGPANGGGEASASPAASSPVPPWYLTLTNEQLTTALLGLGNLDAGYAGTEVLAMSHECLDATAAVLTDSGRKAGPVQARFARLGDGVHKDRVISIQEALASYVTDQAASAAMNQFNGWVSRCGNVSINMSFGPTALSPQTVRVTTLSFQRHADETLAATWSSHYSTLGFRGPSTSNTQQSILVVVRLHRTLCLLAIASEPVEDGHGYPSPPAINDVNGIVTTAISDLTSLKAPG
jgi:hypothetical protein